MVLLRTWHAIHDHFKGDKNKLFLFTLAMLVITEVPIWMFTALDLLALPSLHQYRLHYAREVSDHLGNRVYPPWEVVKKTMKVAEFNLLFAYLVPGYLAIKASNALKIYLYDFDRESLTYWRAFKESLAITVVADIMFYWIHRFLHTSSYYTACVFFVCLVSRVFSWPLAAGAVAKLTRRPRPARTVGTRCTTSTSTALR